LKARKTFYLFVICLAACTLPARPETITLNVADSVTAGSPFDVLVQVNGLLDRFDPEYRPESMFA